MVEFHACAVNLYQATRPEVWPGMRVVCRQSCLCLYVHGCLFLYRCAVNRFKFRVYPVCTIILGINFSVLPYLAISNNFSLIMNCVEGASYGNGLHS